MSERPLLAVGLMSGTSLDGMDAALVRIHGPTAVELLGFVSLPYSPADRARIERVITVGGTRELALLHAAVAEWAAAAVHRVLETAHVRASELDFIAFHGQTVWHEPPTVTMQLGEPAMLAETFGCRVVSGFRARDVAAGGQGAPLVPIADVLLFGGEDPRILVNLGGMANLTWVPRRVEEDGAFAFDTGPGMALIDGLARRADPSLPYDVDGALALRGRPDLSVVTALLADPYFEQAPPKSTGRERFGAPLIERLARDLPGADGVATALELTVRSVAGAIERFTPGAAEVVVAGGGRRHPVVMRALTERLHPRSVRLFDELFFDGDAKEAVAFALIGYLTIHGQPGNLIGATGARGRRVLGSLTPA